MPQGLSACLKPAGCELSPAKGTLLLLVLHLTRLPTAVLCLVLQHDGDAELAATHDGWPAVALAARHCLQRLPPACAAFANQLASQHPPDAPSLPLLMVLLALLLGRGSAALPLQQTRVTTPTAGDHLLLLLLPPNPQQRLLRQFCCCLGLHCRLQARSTQHATRRSP
jgi:hypothetical protein